MIIPTDPDYDTMLAAGTAAVELIAGHRANVRSAPTDMIGEDIDAALTSLQGPPPREPTDWSVLLKWVDATASRAIQIGSHPRDVSHIPSSGQFTAVMGRMLAAGYNRYTGVVAPAPALCALGQGLGQWMARDLFGLPTATSGAVFTSGASEGTRRAVVAARARLATVDVRRAVVYLTGQTHHSVRQALHDAGIPADCLRVLPTTPDLRIDLAAAEAMIRRDRRWRRRIPWLIVSTFGTTNTGTVDNLAAISDLAARYEMWHHCDAAYGGGFALTKLGQDRMDGIQQADSLVFDQHKGWSHPFGLSTLLVARLTDLQDAYTPRGADYLPPSSVHGLVDNNTLGPEQTRPDRGIEAALPLYAHGTDALTEHLDQMLDLTHIAYHDLTANPLLDLPWVPDLSIVAVRLRDRTDSAQRALLHALNASGRAIVSGTTIRGQIFLRLCLLAHNTGPDDVADILDLIHHHTKDQ